MIDAHSPLKKTANIGDAHGPFKLKVKTNQADNNRPAAPISIGSATTKTKNDYFRLIDSSDTLFSKLLSYPVYYRINLNNVKTFVRFYRNNRLLLIGMVFTAGFKPTIWE